MSFPTFETERLLLRAFALTDAEAVQRLAGDIAIADTTLNIPHPYEDGMAEQWIASHTPAFEAGKLANFAIVLRSTGELIGAVGLVITRASARAELGYWISRPYWGQGFCTEACHAILQYGFSNLQLHRIYACHLTRNPASGRVMQKLGMVREGRSREHVMKWDQFEDVDQYGILRAEWEGRDGQ